MQHAAYVLLLTPLPISDLQTQLRVWSLCPWHVLLLAQASRGQLSENYQQLTYLPVVRSHFIRMDLGWFGGNVWKGPMSA